MAKLLNLSDKKFISQMEDASLDSRLNINNCSSFGAESRKKLGGSRCEINCPVDEDNELVTKNDPRNNGRKTAYSHTEWAEHGFHITTRP